MGEEEFGEVDEQVRFGEDDRPLLVPLEPFVESVKHEGQVDSAVAIRLVPGAHALVQVEQLDYEPADATERVRDSLAGNWKSGRSSPAMRITDWTTLRGVKY